MSSPWPRHSAELLDEHPGRALSADELETVPLGQVFVRCYDCEGEADGCESCEGTGFDWSDTADVRATLAALIEAAPVTRTEPAE